jgi:hypothetical protein
LLFFDYDLEDGDDGDRYQYRRSFRLVAS